MYSELLSSLKRFTSFGENLKVSPILRNILNGLFLSFVIIKLFFYYIIIKDIQNLLVFSHNMLSDQIYQEL